MADGVPYVRKAGRKATVEIEKRPSQSKSVTDEGKGGTDPSRLIHDIRNAYAHEEFDAGSAILACNFPPSVTINQAENFFRWIGPVVRVDRADSLHMESNFVVVFATAEHAERANNSDLRWDEKGTKIYTRMADRRPTLWEGFSNWMGWGQGPQPPTATQAQATGNAQIARSWLEQMTTSTSAARMTRA